MWTIETSVSLEERMDEESDFLEWWDMLDDIEREEYNRWREEIEQEESE